LSSWWSEATCSGCWLNASKSESRAWSSLLHSQIQRRGGLGVKVGGSPPSQPSVPTLVGWDRNRAQMRCTALALDSDTRNGCINRLACGLRLEKAGCGSATQPAHPGGVPAPMPVPARGRGVLLPPPGAPGGRLPSSQRTVEQVGSSYRGVLRVRAPLKGVRSGQSGRPPIHPCVWGNVISAVKPVHALPGPKTAGSTDHWIVRTSAKTVSN